MSEPRFIIFEYQQTERRFRIYQNENDEAFFQTVKTVFGLPADETITLLDPDTNYYIVPSIVQNLLINREDSTPKYRLITRNETGTDKDGWFKWFLENYISKFLQTKSLPQQKKND